MQTFMPYPSFEASLRCLDYVRLNKQGSEGRQLVKTLVRRKDPEEKRTGWMNHPAAKMWIGYEDALKCYTNLAILLWIERGYNNTRQLFRVRDNHQLVLPPWMGDEKFHASHRAALLFKDYEWYSQFGWTEEPEYNYVWPGEQS